MTSTSGTTPAERITLPETWLDDDPDHDPYAAFDAQMGAGRTDPYPVFRELRGRGGVARLAPSSPLEAIEADEPLDLGIRVWEPGDPEEPVSYGIYTYEGVTNALRDWQTFTSTAYAESMGLVFGHSILEMDPPEHHEHRALVSQAFRSRTLARWEERLVRPVVDEQLDTFADRGEAELTREFTIAYPVKVIAGILGVPLEHWDWFRRRAIEEISLASDVERGLEASRVLKEYFGQIIALRRAEPADDLISELVRAELDGRRLSDEEILPFLMLLSPAGAETTYRSTGNLLYGLLTNPAQLEAVRADRSLLGAAIEEAIRWEPPLTGIGRRATRDVDVHGVEIPAGANVHIGLGSANRDETVWGDDAEEFDLFREPRQHVAFAFGPHMCLGMHLARMEMTIAMNALLDRLEDLHLDPATVEETYVDGQGFRSPNQLRVRFRVGRR